MQDSESKKSKTPSVVGAFSKQKPKGSVEGKTPMSNPRSVVGEAPQACAYISAMATELQRIALDTNLPVIAYFLDMARVEAESIIRLSEVKVRA